ncbi:MAG: hypothetical protein ABW069_01620 [Duganella sp.]
MTLTAAIMTIGRVTLAVVMVPLEDTYAEPGARRIAEAQRVFPTLPIMLVSPRVGGFSRSFAHFDVTGLISQIDTDTVAWRLYTVADGDARTGPLPF